MVESLAKFTVLSWTRAGYCALCLTALCIGMLNTAWVHNIRCLILITFTLYKNNVICDQNLILLKRWGYNNFHKLLLRFTKADTPICRIAEHEYSSTYCGLLMHIVKNLCDQYFQETLVRDQVRCKWNDLTATFLRLWSTEGGWNMCFYSWRFIRLNCVVWLVSELLWNIGNSSTILQRTNTEFTSTENMSAFWPHGGDNMNSYTTLQWVLFSFI